MMQRSPVVNKSIWAAAIATSLEWYDFTVFVYLAPYISKLFFPHTNTLISLMSTFAIFASGYIARPLGGLVFGNLGDKIGRKKVIMLTVSLMTASMILTSILPTYNTIGIVAVVLLLLARILQGFSVGGEYTGVLVMLIEQAEPERRGTITALGTMVSGSGVLLSSFVVMLLTYSLSTADILAWGWRIPFVIGVVLSLFCLWLQRYMHESPLFQQVQQQDEVVSFPLWLAIKTHWIYILCVLMLTGYLGIAYYLAAAFLPTYLQTVLQIKHSTAMTVTVFGAAIYAFAAPGFGSLTDRVGRKPVLIISTITLALTIYPLFIIFSHKMLFGMLFAECILMLCISASTAAFVVYINEFFPTRHRLSGVAAGYNLGNAIFGGTTPLVMMYLIHTLSSHMAPCYYLIAVSVIILPVMLLLPETKNRDL